MSAQRKYNASGDYSSMGALDKEQSKVQANTPSGHANIKAIAKNLAPYTEEAIAFIVQVMRDTSNKTNERFAAAKYIVNESINSLAQMDRQKLMVKQIAMMDAKIKESELRVTKVEDELASADDDDVTRSSVFSMELVKS